MKSSSIRDVHLNHHIKAAIFNRSSYSDSLLRVCKEFHGFNRGVEIFSRERNEIAMMLQRCYHRCILSRPSCLRLRSVLSHTGTSSLPPTATMHQRRYIVRLTSRHFKGYNFPPTRTKYVIAIRARNTFSPPPPYPPPLPTSSSMSLFFRGVGDIRHPFMDHKARLAFSARSRFLAMGTAARLSTNSPAGRYLINLWRRREFLVAQMQPPKREEFSRIFCAATILF